MADKQPSASRKPRTSTVGKWLDKVQDNSGNNRARAKSDARVGKETMYGTTKARASEHDQSMATLGEIANLGGGIGKTMARASAMSDYAKAKSRGAHAAAIDDLVKRGRGGSQIRDRNGRTVDTTAYRNASRAGVHPETNHMHGSGADQHKSTANPGGTYTDKNGHLKRNPVPGGQAPIK